MASASVKYSNLKTVITKQDVNIFASSWETHTTTSEVHDCVDNILQGHNKDTVPKQNMNIYIPLSMLVFQCQQNIWGMLLTN